MSLSVFLSHFHYFGIFIILILGELGFPFPEGVTLIGCGFLISTNIVRPVQALFIVFSGILIGDLLSYYFGKKYGRSIVTHKRFHKILSPERLSMLEDSFNKRGILFILIGGRLISGIFIVAGILKMPFSKLMVIDAISSLFAVTIWVGTGYIGGHSLQVIMNDMTRIEHIGILFVILLLDIYLMYRYFKSQRDKTSL
jgi:membrane protein DedA with SNARE-associated domain